MTNKEEFWQPYREFVANNTIAYNIISEELIESYPLVIAEHSETNRIAFLILPTYDGKTMTGDLTKTTDLVSNSLLRLLTEAKKVLASKGLDVPLLIQQVRLVYTPKTGKKQLTLNKQWLF